MKFKQAIAYRVPAHAAAWLRARSSEEFTEDSPLAQHIHNDPTGAAWLDLGLRLVDDVSPVIDLNGAGLLLAVQFNERILPGKVRDEHVELRAKDIEAREGRRPGKKEYAQLRDEVEADLLPVSHIKRTVVPVIVSNDGLMFVFSSSAKRADDVVNVLWAVVPSMNSALVRCVQDVAASLTLLARDVDDDDREVNFRPVSGALLRGPNGESFRIKDVEIERAMIQQLLETGHEVHELDMELVDNDEAVASFNVNRALAIRRFRIADVHKAEAKGDQAKMDMQTDAWLALTVLRTLFQRLMAEMGGEVMPEFPESEEL